jgi:hypothetical protein
VRDADVVLIRQDPHRDAATATRKNFVGWSPHDGIELLFRAAATFGEYLAADGRGYCRTGSWGPSARATMGSPIVTPRR